MALTNEEKIKIQEEEKFRAAARQEAEKSHYHNKKWVVVDVL